MARNALLRTPFINSRIACISVLIRGGELSILNTYVPKNARPEDERRDHFEKLQQAISQIARKGPFVVLGDFNSRRQGRHALGPHMFRKGWTAVGEETDNRFLLLDFCRANDLIVANTWFQQPAAKQATFKEPSAHFLPPDNTDWDPANVAQLDFFLPFTSALA